MFVIITFMTILPADISSLVADYNGATNQQKADFHSVPLFSQLRVDWEGVCKQRWGKDSTKLQGKTWEETFQFNKFSDTADSVMYRNIFLFGVVILLSNFLQQRQFCDIGQEYHLSSIRKNLGYFTTLGIPAIKFALDILKVSASHQPRMLKLATRLACITAPFIPFLIYSPLLEGNFSLSPEWKVCR